MNSPVINPTALEPLFAPHEEPNRHRVRRSGEEGAEIQRGRRPSPLTISNSLRSYVKTFRESDYAGASDTTRELLHHWFARDHTTTSSEGDRVPFRYYFCQQEGIETLIYLHEVRGIRSLAEIVGEFGGGDALTAALGVDPGQDRWARYAFKLATGAGKTKVMSLAIVWSYFHALRESDSPMARHFVVIAPGLTVFERLKEDFGLARIFDSDPLIPPAWRGDWNISTVLQDGSGGSSSGGTIYLTNIHQLYDPRKRGTREAEYPDWMGPSVSRTTVLDTAEELRSRITAHDRLIVLNDEAHHVWDSRSAWNEAIAFLHGSAAETSGERVVAQLDFSATPKDDKGQLFQHIVCDSPLGEAVDGGIVKTPVIGRGEGLIERTSDDASEKYQHHLTIGYERWRRSYEEWIESGKKALLFVMAEDTEAANQIANRLNSDPQFEKLNGRTINLHTRLKGKVKKVGRGKNARVEFVEDERAISDEDLRELRRLSRELDSGDSPYCCIVSVLMLREGWDVRNVTTIVPLRPYTSDANILPEQTLGRGLRRMMPTENVAEIVTVVEHPAFVGLYQQQLSQEGLHIESVDVDDVPRTTVTIYPDGENKDLSALDIEIPSVSVGYRRTASTEGIASDSVRRQFSGYQPLTLGEEGKEEVQYEGRHLITNEVVERMRIHLPLLENPVGAISFFRQELEQATGLRGTHAVLAPLIEEFLTEMLFGERVDLFDRRLLARVAAPDVRAYVRATFVPLLLEHTTIQEERSHEGTSTSVVSWKPFQATHSERQPAAPANKTPFNLVTCNRELEVAMAQLLDRPNDVAAFCKNAGPQALRIDYQTEAGRLSLYTPDFLARTSDGKNWLIETKGRVDRDVPLKAQAAVAWCRSASESDGVDWEYVYVPQGVFQAYTGNDLALLAQTCATSQADLLRETVDPQLALPFGEEVTPDEDLLGFIASENLGRLPRRSQKGVEQAVSLYTFLEKKDGASLAAVFTPLLGPLDHAAKVVMTSRLLDRVPDGHREQREYFSPSTESLPSNAVDTHKRQGANLRRTLVDGSGLMPIGLLRWCLDYAAYRQYLIGGVFESIRTEFGDLATPDLVGQLGDVYAFRNEYVAHQDAELLDKERARATLKDWIAMLDRLWSYS